MSSIRRLVKYVVLAAVLLVAACLPPTPDRRVQINIIYAPESERYMRPAIDAFNQAYVNGNDPLTGKPLAADDQPIKVSGETGASGQIMQGIVNAIIAPNNANVKKPTIFMPAVSHWLSLANLQTGKQVFDVTNSPATTNDPVVIAIWKSRLDAIQKAYPGQQIGWKELMDVMTNPKGWAAYGLTGRSTIYYGHTDPYVSSSGLSTLISEFYACAWYKIGFTGTRLTQNEVNTQAVQDCVRDLHHTIRHYSINTTVFKKYIACGGPDYIDFVALPEDEFLQITQGTEEVDHCPLKEPMIALYPREGTFYHEHPFAIVNADWVTPEQKQAAEKFKAYVVSAGPQALVLPGGFRPANPAVPLGFPIVTALGVDPNEQAIGLDVPDPNVIDAIQRSWSYVKRQADIWLVLDISGSMNDQGKLDKARQAALAFVDKVESQNRVGLIVFNSDTKVLVPLDVVERNKAALKEQISSLSASGGTALFDGLQVTMDQYKSDAGGDRIRAIVLLTDGQDTDSKSAQKGNVISQIETSRSMDSSPLLVIPIGYGSDADIGTLNAIARASTANEFSGDQTNIDAILQEISKEF